ncbi:GntK Gluconate kinase [Pyrenophora tritici-repentis]|uniref:Gluconokinase n=2 Tax=Pyrenophora tritici-repentis TaxID=45151 RepID=A0A2W1DPP7_9PLEO|nr:thermoresistant gluconokinase family protein [Pyrenophora tritici-repentis Pt-1C-BFP]KAA8624423.1 thermosensitive gluconokinase [Pyrenophora tritici-repentis]EDU44450.1 thermoresistant gluconokinase family protein [Pyrenophora tritici-repentis Pt-1C-BFP]KAF7452825.1 thermosensitive gluconokinase [Pyrenophora tritici-repentis]KAF7575853.1 GntK, Gluconate kinase [Pyrenophora tritici-repentis]KAG9377728.1 thermosensitive gluconokinase [Pyrenophora tritici-repentis]
MMQTMEQSPPKPIQYVSPPTPPASNTGSPSSKSAVVLSESSPTEMAIAHHHHILIVTGPAGCGKSTIAQHLSDRYGFDYIEGDEFHPQANIDKMAAGIPLNDEDRWDWLILLRDQALTKLKHGSKGVVVTCSALKKKYRDVIRTARLYDEDPNANVHFVYLRSDKETLLARVRARKGHYMKDAMVESQFAALEEPDETECKQLKDVEIIEVKGSIQDVQDLAGAAVDKILAQ